MTRTQLYLDPESRTLAVRIAKREGTTVSEIIRRSIKHYAEPKLNKGNKDVIAWITALNKKYPTPPNTPADLALEHDHYLYGTLKRYSKT